MILTLWLNCIKATRQRLQEIYLKVKVFFFFNFIGYCKENVLGINHRLCQQGEVGGACVE